MSKKPQSSGPSAAYVWFNRKKMQMQRKETGFNKNWALRNLKVQKKKPINNLTVDGIEMVRSLFKKVRQHKIVASVMTRAKPVNCQRWNLNTQELMVIDWTQVRLLQDNHGQVTLVGTISEEGKRDKAENEKISLCDCENPRNVKTLRPANMQPTTIFKVP